MKIEICKGKGGYFLRLVAKNGETLAVSEMYRTKWNAKRAAAKNFVGIPLVEAE